jgi:hypothetical protein
VIPEALRWPIPLGTAMTETRPRDHATVRRIVFRHDPRARYAVEALVRDGGPSHSSPRVKKNEGHFPTEVLMVQELWSGTFLLVHLTIGFSGERSESAATQC